MVTPYGLDILIISSVNLINKFRWNLSREDPRQDRELSLAADGFKTRHNGNIDTFGRQSVTETIEILVIVEELSYDVLRAKINLPLEPIYIAAHIRGLGVLLGVAGHTKGELDLRFINNLSINRQTIVEIIDLRDEIRGMLVRQFAGDYRLLVIVTTK